MIPATAEWLAAAYANGLVIDAILLLLLVEALVLRRLRWRWAMIAATLLPGALLFLALRAALTGMGWPWVALFITLSLPVHIADVVSRRNG